MEEENSDTGSVNGDDLCVEIGDGKFKCNFEGCSKFFSSKWSLTRHIRTHTGDKAFRCCIVGCNKAFVQKCSLTRHEQTHADGQQWMCDYYGCGKRFKLKEYLGKYYLFCITIFELYYSTVCLLKI